MRAYGDARMTGSGACCFVAFQHQADASAALAALHEQTPELNGFVARGLECHPLWSLGETEKPTGTVYST
jgi:4-diphosphocytidyl-2-C-methyl-D-erythritol kinase